MPGKQLSKQEIEDQLDFLRYIRRRKPDWRKLGKSWTKMCKWRGHDYKTVRVWARRHAINIDTPRRRSWKDLRRCVLEAYGPWVKTTVIRKDFYPELTLNSVEVTKTRLNVRWSSDSIAPVIPYRDIYEIACMVEELESLYLVREKCGYNMSALLQVFHLRKRGNRGGQGWKVKPEEIRCNIK